jgi:hypothetical protein
MKTPEEFETLISTMRREIDIATIQSVSRVTKVQIAAMLLHDELAALITDVDSTEAQRAVLNLKCQALRVMAEDVQKTCGGAK